MSVVHTSRSHRLTQRYRSTLRRIPGVVAVRVRGRHLIAFADPDRYKEVGTVVSGIEKEFRRHRVRRDMKRCPVQMCAFCWNEYER